MGGSAHDSPRFRNAVEYTIAITVTLAGGARHGTADRRAERLAERLANTAARCGDAVQVTAVAGPSHHGNAIRPQPVHFAAANSGRGTYAEPAKLDRYLDPDHELALRSLAAAEEAFTDHLQADRARRRAVGCRNTRCSLTPPERACECVYCLPEEHCASLRGRRRRRPDPLATPRCVCGAAVPLDGQRCPHHRAVAVVVLDGDAPALRLLADELENAS